jgi:hypothetical protein
MSPPPMAFCAKTGAENAAATTRAQSFIEFMLISFFVQ